MNNDVVFETLNYKDHFLLISRVYVSMLQYRLYFGSRHSEITSFLKNSGQLSHRRPCAIPTGLKLLVNEDGSFRENARCVQKAYMLLSRNQIVNDPVVANKAMIACYMLDPDLIEQDIATLCGLLIIDLAEES